MFTVRNHQVAAHTGISVKLPEKENRERGMAPSEYRPDRGENNREPLVGKMLLVPQDNDERLLERHQYVGRLKALAAAGIPLSAGQKQALSELFSVSGFYMLAHVRQAPSGVDLSDAELWEMVTDKISATGEHYLGVYENVVAVYTRFYQDYSNILSALGGWLLPGKDGNNVKLDVMSLMQALNQLLQEYGSPSEKTVLFPAQSGGTLIGATETEARQWLEELNLPETCLKPVGTGYVVLVDLTPVQKMVDDLNGLGRPGDDSKLEMDNAKYQAWQSGFKAQEENMKTTLQTLTQKYSNANSLYDNLVKVLSSTISSCMEAAKSFLQR
ncbi:TPA: IpaD/SipD/SspD family type III secretion system needle tip protein [Escherichia coli]|uniref:type III secretion system needle tip protein SctA n=1 Tax=Escherichia TaxID=561 RepID=UPI000BDF3B94|nr:MULTISPECIES: type III secretion system needle tip protein SctA [Escherichia]EDR1715314.1 IpaD/SipD/SspD family type III secretion system needle tip protein [Salmonella enterica subsp. enterica serovar Mississippi]EEC2923333.1 IpaD/SipD/SspD family type III secretion system needle tip protein [Salmonella enterica subsp. enterica serovar Enteritidis]ELG0279956.1 type III secretion system needle tip protein SctA [Salmonella enterica]EFH0456449.1 IpaD/SipD/SspD family type III secretion system 